jgi:NitT/TauT family transport system permease protein
LKVLTSIVIPSATSWILASLHVAFGFALIGAVVGEVIGAKRGLGLLIAHSQGTFDAAGIYAGMIIITVIALGAEWLLTALEKRLLRWRPPSATEASQI